LETTILCHPALCEKVKKSPFRSQIHSRVKGAGSGAKGFTQRRKAGAQRPQRKNEKGRKREVRFPLRPLRSPFAVFA
jgi:hypothetical protein